MSIEEIVLPLTEPETEWVRGRALPKMSSTRSHSRLQMRFAAALDTWAGSRGQVGTEWRFRIALPGEARRPLVPDVAFVAADRSRGLSFDELEAPGFAPTVAVEVLSRGDHRLDVVSKIDTYLLGGSVLVIVIDPDTRTITLYDASSSTVLARDEVLRHRSLPGFELAIEAFFEGALELPA